MTFAAITAALIVGATVERMRFAAVLLFTGLFLTIVYAPIAHMVWAADGLIFTLGGGASIACYAFIAGTKQRLRLDDSFDVFGIHGLGGIVGSLGTAVAALPALGGHGAGDYALGHQLLVQGAAVGVAIGWSAGGTALALVIVRRVLPLRRSHDEEREGLDLAEHGERAYN